MLRYKAVVIFLALLLVTLIGSQAQAQKVSVVNDQSGSKIVVDGQDFLIKGMNWDYVPIGKNYAYSLWTQPDDFIKQALANEMPLLKNMGVNVIRHYVGMPPRWVKYIYETYGIYTVINHPLGRYGVTIDGAWIPSTDYSDEKTRAQLKAEIAYWVDQFKDTPGMLFWLLGNENNYGLTWKSAETEALPEGERHAAKARYMYSLFGEITDMIKESDSRPVAMANGDLQYIDILAEEVKNLDIMGSNVYRGISARDAFEVVKEKLGIPLLFTEFGSDAFNAKTMTEDQAMQAKYLIGQWQEIYEQSYGKGLVGNAAGGFTFQFSDGWWKYKQEENLDIHDINASWPNGGYQEDFVQGENNMNEEWWGICAKGFPDAYGYYQLYPRAAYYALKKAYQLDPYGTTTLEKIRAHFSNITAMGATLEARGDKAALAGESSSKVRVSGLRMEFETISTGGDKITTPKNVSDTTIAGYPKFQGFDHFQSYYIGVEAKPAPNIIGNMTVNYIGNVPENPIDEIFYENRARVVNVLNADSSETELKGIERVKVYNASVKWEDRWFSLNGFYRTGHYHWGYEGDFFGLYREANYGPNIDTYNGEAPLGMEVAGKHSLNGLKVAIGPELWWGANPAVLVKYQRQFGRFLTTGIYQEDLDEQGNAVTSSAIPIPTTRKATLHMETQHGKFNIEFGGIWSGDNKVGQTYQLVKKDFDYYQTYNDTIYIARIKQADAFGGKFKISYNGGKINWYLQAALMGRVADGGPTATQTFSGWWLKDSGKGNQKNIITGFSTRVGYLEIAPNFLWQKPLTGPMPSNLPALTQGRLRDYRTDPFSVRENREMTAAELILTYDPTPATWMYHWDSDVREDAVFACTFGVIFKHMPTSMDASIGFLEDGRTTFAFPASTPPRDVWETYMRIVSKPKPGWGLVANIYAGDGEPNGDDTRLIKRYGSDVRLIIGSMKFISSVKLNDWGPYDYHRDFNMTYPAQFGFDISTASGIPDWFDMPQTRIGIKATIRVLDEYSNRYAPELGPVAQGIEDFVPTADEYGYGNEWEIRTYLHLNIGL